MKKCKLDLTKASLFVVMYILMATVFIGCSKEDAGGGNNNYYFRAKVNGVQHNFLHSAVFHGGGDDDKLVHVGIVGYVSPVDFSKPIEQTPHSLEFDLWNEGGTFSPGIYTQNGGGPSDDGNPLTYSIDMEYHIQTKAGTIQYDARETGDFTLEIIEINKSHGVKGKFKGTISHENNINDKKVITDGEFYLPADKVI